MRHTFSRINPNTTHLQRPYRDYQALAIEQRTDFWPVPPDTSLPPQIQHIGRLNPLKSWDHTPEQRGRRQVSDSFIDSPNILAAAANLTLELENRARWLAERATVKVDEGSAKTGGHKLEATLPLELGDDFANAQAQIGFYSQYNRIPRKRAAALHLGHLSIEVSGTNTAQNERFWTYASMGSYMLDLVHIDTSGYEPTVLYGPSLMNGFELRDMLTFVENSAPDAMLSPQAYGLHVLQDPALAPEQPALV